MLRTDGGYGLPGMPGNGATVSPAAKFNPNQLNVQPMPGYMNMPGYNPFQLEQDRDRFILHSPKSGVANNPLQDPRFQIPGGQPWNKTPILPGKETEDFNKRPINLTPQLPSAVLPGSSNLPNAIGNMAGVANSQFYGGPQLGQAGLYFGGVM